MGCWVVEPQAQRVGAVAPGGRQSSVLNEISVRILAQLKTTLRVTASVPLTATVAGSL